MNREEAIEYFESRKNLIITSPELTDMKELEAFKMAIEALKLEKEYHGKMRDISHAILNFNLERKHEEEYWVIDMKSVDVVISPKGLFRKKVVSMDRVSERLRALKEKNNIKSVPVGEWMEIDK